MKKVTLVLLTFSICVSINAQLKPTKEEIEKYGYLMGDIDRKKPLNDSYINKIDSIYATDTNSILLKWIIGEMNFRLIDSLRMDRIPQTIAIVNHLLTLYTKEDDKANAYTSLARLYKYQGDYTTSTVYYQKVLTMEIDSDFYEMGLNNLAGAYNIAGDYKKALETISKSNNAQAKERSLSLRADIYFNNGMHDSAFHYANLAIERDSLNYYSYSLKAKVLLKKDKNNADICPLLAKAHQIIRSNNVLSKLLLSSDNNPFIRGLKDDIIEVKQLEADYCN